MVNGQGFCGQGQREVFAVMFFTTRIELVAYQPMFAGSLASTQTYPCEILQRALYHRASIHSD